ESGGQAVQVVEPPHPFAADRVDLRSLPAAEREAEALRLAAEAVRVPFDLKAGGLLRVTLFELGDEHHLLLLVIHHIVADGWSMGVLLAELTALYEAFATGHPLPPEPPLQYADFAVWQRGWMSGEVLAGQLAYWRGRLAGAPPLLELPTDRPRPAELSFRGARRPLALPAELGRELMALGRRENLTPFMVLFGGFAALLARYTGQTDLVVGSPIANRRRTEIEGLVGFFVNNLVLRVDLDGDPGFRELGSRVREAALGAFAHQDLPFEKLVDELRPERALSYSALFQVMFNLQNARPPKIELSRLTLTPLAVELSRSPFDLSVNLLEGADGFAGGLEYATDLFDPETADRLARHFEALLRGIAAEPGRRLSEIPLLSAAERRQLLADWNDTGRDWPAGTLVHELFEAQAARTPDAVAVADGTETLTYAGLDERANRLAHHLRSLGAGPEALVGLCVERSAAMVVALLAVLKSGAAYVPLDPSHPAERREMVLADSGVSLLLTDERLLADREAIAAASPEAPERRTSEESLAYAIFTSGSTGRPKGVQLPHRAVVSFLRAMAERPGMREGDVVPALTTLSFDIAGLEIYLPLSVGGRIEVVGRDEAADGARLAARIAAAGVTVLQATPATWRLLLEAGWAGVPRLKALCGGEALPPDLAAALLARGLELWNVYGPTETAIWSAAGEVRPGEPVLIGPPIANTHLYVVDRSLGPVPVGVGGELLIGGAGLARGYLGRPDLTAERFIPHPFAASAGARVYRTGDLVRYRPSGLLEFLGRIDHQVKVRGFRIELGEIEAALARHPAVRQAVVTVRDDGGEKRLAAYVVPHPETGALPIPAAGELRDFLFRSLPEYMLPASFTSLAELPLSPSGKLDRRALPAPEAGASGGERIEPRGPIEELLAEIWAEILGLGRVGARDNFFELGGHSLLATRVVSRVRGAFGVDLPLRRLFEVPTVAGLAHAVEAARAAGSAPLPPLARTARSGPPRLSFAQERLWFLDRLSPGTAVYTISSAHRVAGAFDAAAFARAIGEIVRRHEALRTTFQLVDGEPRQIIAPEGTPEIATVDLSALAPERREAEARRRIQAVEARPFDLATGPLLRTLLVRLEAADWIVLPALHHIVGDGWSMDVLVREMLALYEAFSRGLPSPLPQLELQYADYAEWQRGGLQGAALEAELAWWRRELVGAPTLLDLPADRPRPTVQRFHGRNLVQPLAPELQRRIGDAGKREGVTLFMTLLAAFQALLARLTGGVDLVIGTPVAGRNRVETEGLIGLFLNSLPLRGVAGGDPSLRRMLAGAREVTLASFAHQDVPFEKLVEAMAPERNLSHAPVYQVMLVLQNAPRQILGLPGLTLTPIELEGSSAKLDLTLNVQETAGGLILRWLYNRDLFDATTVARWAGHLETLLAGGLEAPERRLSELPLLTAAEARQLVEWNDTGVEYRTGIRLHEL
ncbi:MAG TPA: amino acid adenylation domain-containing protein, partial [Thermoanaerobaculia bacterium]